MCYQNGGGAFLIPFLICLFIIGMPCMYLELAAGQFFHCGNITIWGKMVPYMKGIGYSCVIINILMLSYYNTLQSYALYYLFYSFQSPVPWSSCENKWNSEHCSQRNNTFDSGLNVTSSIIYAKSSSADNGSATTPMQPTSPVDVLLPANEFFTRKLLGSYKSKGFTDLVGLKPGYN